MFKKRLLWKLFGMHLLVVLLCALAVGVNALSWIRPFHQDQKRQELLDKARLIVPEVLQAIGQSPAAVDRLCKNLGKVSATRVTIVDPSGDVLGDSEAELPLPSHADRPECRQALVGEVGTVVRWSETIRADMLYVAVPLRSDGRIVGALRMSLGLNQLQQALDRVTGRIFVGSLTVAALAAVLALVISRHVSRPLEEMRRGVERFAEGDFTRKLPLAGSDEIASLARSLNAMALQLNERIETALRLQRELHAVLASMTEGVLAVDHDDRVISINDVALRLFGVEARDVRGRSLPEVIRHPETQDFVARVRAAHGVSEGEVLVETPEGQRRLQLHGSMLHDAQDRRLGVLVVIRDVTRLRHLETVRRDFVANVSHELKTPITAIRGASETLRDAIGRDAQAAARFLEVMDRQAARMAAIIDDLLTLARLEQTDARPVELAECRVADLLQAAVNDCRHKAQERNVQITVDCPADLRARLSAELVEQALANLLDNAVKYSSPGAAVSVRASHRGMDLAIAVADHGCGIPNEHLNRLFERFYTVDPARSRKLGGTGLGLAIVKHIAQAHGGSVTVESTVAHGSTFTLHLPTVVIS